MKTKGRIAFAAVIVALGAVLVATQTARSGGQSRTSKIVISINDVLNGAPVIQVQNAANGYDIDTGEVVANPAIEEGALITLFGVDTGGAIPDWGGRFVLPEAPNPSRTAVDIVWVEHNFYVPEDDPHYGDLIVGFDSALPDTYYLNPDLRGEDSLGLVTDNWVTVYENYTLVVRFKPHTYRLRN